MELYPAHVDGNSLVILRQRNRWFGSPFSVVASGWLEYDGETLMLVGEDQRRVITEEEQTRFMLVKPDSRITECRGFDWFLLQD